MAKNRTILVLLFLISGARVEGAFGLQSAKKEAGKKTRQSAVKVEATALSYKMLSEKIQVALISPDCSRFIMLLADFLKGAEKPVVVSVDGDRKEYPNFDVNSIRFSKDSKRYGFAAWNGGKFQMVVDGQPVGVPAEVATGLVFSPDGQKYSYVAGIQGSVSVANTSDPKFRVIQSLTFSTDSKRLAYMGSKGKHGRGASLVVDGKVIAEDAHEFPQSLFIGPQRAMIVLTKADGKYVFDGNEIEGPYYDVPFYTLSENGADSLCVIQKGERDRQQLFVNSRKILDFDEALAVSWSSRQEKSICVVRDGELEKAYVGEKLVGEGKNLEELTPMGNNGVGFIKKDPIAGDQLFIDGKPAFQAKGLVLVRLDVSDEGNAWGVASIAPKGEPGDKILACIINGKTSKKYNDLTRVSFSSNGKHWAYGAWDENDYYIITPENSYGPYDSNGSPPKMSPDGKHFVFFGSTQDGQTGIFVDGELLFESLAPVDAGNERWMAFEEDSALNAVVIFSQKRLSLNFMQVRFSW